MSEKENIPVNNVAPVVNSEKNKVVETYAEDMAGIIEQDQEGLIKRIIHEQEANEEMKKKFSPKAIQNKLYIVFGVLFILFALVIFLSIFFRKSLKVVLPQKQFTPIVFNDKSFFIETADLSKERIFQSILTEIRESDLKEGGVEGIYFIKDKQFLGLRDFLNTLKSNLVLSDNIISDNFLLGFVNKDKTKDPFIIIKVASFQDIFEPIKTWENKMFYDLHTLFGVPINEDTSYLLTKNFEDDIVENKNARILYDKDGKIIIMYVFADNHTVIIGNTNTIVRELIDRLSGAQIKK